MYDREMAQAALQRMSIEHRSMAEAKARARGVSACDVVLEEALLVSQELASDALFALRQQQARPTLRVV
ncbi:MULTISPECIES: hypothetical protein [Halomonadaceae]|uniref:hypothetical protein n=1 Tax=Halomonadaceae TaxID=28256 RepID=UPI0015982EA1|nr:MULTISPECIES: hypothetical protein [Halomonas]QJQ93939.1 hypothetical protein HIO72_00590 [Halomonas sp. PA5]